MPLLYRLSLSCPLTCTDTSKAVSTGMKKVWAPLTLNIWVRLFENQHFQWNSHLEYETHDQSGLLPIEISRALEHAHVISVQVVQGWLCQEFLCVQINEKLRLTKGNGDQGFKNGIDHVQNLSRSMYAFWSFATKSKQFEAIGIRTCSSPLADRPGISGATISAWFTKIPVPLSKLEPAPSNGEYANLNSGWERLKI